MVSVVKVSGAPSNNDDDGEDDDDAQRVKFIFHSPSGKLIHSFTVSFVKYHMV